MEHTYGIEQGGNYREQGRLISLLRDLTEPDRALLESRLVDGWDYTTIALRLGIPRADLVKRVQRIRTGLRRKAKALGAGETRFDLAGVNVRLKCSAVKARLPHVYDGNGAGRSTRTWGVSRPKKQPAS